MQQVEHFGDPTINVNDAFKAVTRYWDRIIHPEQIISSLPQAVAVDARSRRLRPGLHRACRRTCRKWPGTIRRPSSSRPSMRSRGRAPTATAWPRPLRTCSRRAKRPLIISGGGVRYSGAEEVVGDFAVKRGIPVAETIAGKGARHAPSSRPYRPDRHRRLDLGQCAGRRGRRHPRHRHAADGFHHRLVDRASRRTRNSSRSTRRALTRPSTGPSRSSATRARRSRELDGRARRLEGRTPPGRAKGTAEFAKWNALLDGYQKPTNEPRSDLCAGGRRRQRQGRRARPTSSPPPAACPAK